MAAQKSVSPAVTVIIIIIVLAIIFAVYWWTSHKPAPTPTGPMIPSKGGVNMPGGMKGMPGGANMPGGAKGMPGGMMKGPAGPQTPAPPAGQ